MSLPSKSVLDFIQDANVEMDIIPCINKYVGLTKARKCSLEFAFNPLKATTEEAIPTMN